MKHIKAVKRNCENCVHWHEIRGGGIGSYNELPDSPPDESHCKIEEDLSEEDFAKYENGETCSLYAAYDEEGQK